VVVTYICNETCNEAVLTHATRPLLFSCITVCKHTHIWRGCCCHCG